MANFLDTTGLTRFWGDMKIFLQSRGAITLDDADKMLVFDDSTKEDINGVSGTYGVLKNLTIGNLKTYLANYFAPVSTADAMIYKGVIDCAANPNYPAANAGDTYKISVAGKIGGASGTVVEAGDMAICITDGTASGTQAGVGANWNVIQMNLGAVVSSVGATAPITSTGGTSPTIAIDPASGSAAGSMSSGDFSKLAGIETAADVTDAGNVAPILAAAGNKATPADADTVAFTDTEATNVLKKLTWTNIKSFLKTYFDTLYNNYTHPTGDGNLHVPANSTTNSGKVLTASGTAGTYTWETPSAEPAAITNGTIDGIVV